MEQKLCSKCGHLNRPVPAKQIAQMYRRGASAREIGVEVGMDTPAVYYHLRRLGVPLRSRGNSCGAGKGQQFRKIALTDEALIPARRAAGETLQAIAASLGVSRQRIAQIESAQKESAK